MSFSTYCFMKCILCICDIGGGIGVGDYDNPTDIPTVVWTLEICKPSTILGMRLDRMAFKRF